MQVEYETEHRIGDYREYQYSLSVLPPSKDSLATQNQPFCCDDMKDAWHDRAIIFNEQTAKVCIAKAEYSEGDSWFEYYPINCCPFCGVKIDLIETKRIEFVKKITPKTINEESWEPVPTS